MLVGNKCDESSEMREVTEIEGQGQATSWNISFMETSAKTNHNVTELFQVNFQFIQSKILDSENLDPYDHIIPGSLGIIEYGEDTNRLLTIGQ